ncbi:MAG: serine protease inhibitor [Synechococcus sp.]
MASSSLSVVSSNGPIVTRRSAQRLWARQLTGPLLVAALVMAACLLAPEEPHQQASICERHHSVAACRVW